MEGSALTGSIGEALRAASNGLTDFELADKLGIPIKQLKASLRELHRADYIYDSGERRLGPTGKAAIWFAAKDVDFNGPLPNVVRILERRRRGRSKKDKEFAVTLATKLLDCVREVALSKETFTPDDVRRLFDASSGNFGKLDKRATGPAMIRAVKEGICVKNKAGIISDRRNAGWTSVYTSLLLEPTDKKEDVDVAWLRARITTLEAENESLRAQLEARRAV